MVCLLKNNKKLLKSENIIIRDSAESYNEQFEIGELHRHIALFLSAEVNIYMLKTLI